MKKNYLLLSVCILSLLSGCNNSNVDGSSTISSSSSSNEVISSTSSYNDYVSSSDKIVNVKLKDLELELNEDETAYYIKKYKKYDKLIRLPESYNDKNIIGIRPSAFISSGGVEDIYFPNTYIDIHPSAFYNCTTIKNYYVEETHEKYSSVDGVLYSKDEKDLIAFPIGRDGTFNVKDGTINILDNAFYTSIVKKVNLPDSVESIGKEAFGYTKRLTSINIPSKVTKIAAGTFDTCLSLYNITFNEKIEEIEFRAFWGCAELKELTFPTSLKVISDSAFESCSNLRKVILNEGLISVGSFSFAYCPEIEELTFPSTLKTIYEYAFIQNTRLESLNFNEGLEYLKEGAFYYTTNVKEVYIPASVKEIGYDCFTSSDSAIRKFVVSDESNYYKDVNYVLYTKDGKTLVCYPADLAHETNDTTYIIEEGTEVIGDHAFYNAEALTSLTLPSSIKEIQRAPFYMCKSLKTLKYLGTKSEFELIEKDVELYQGELEIFWYETYYGYIRQVSCSDGLLNIQ